MMSKKHCHPSKPVQSKHPRQAELHYNMQNYAKPPWIMMNSDVVLLAEVNPTFENNNYLKEPD